MSFDTYFNLEDLVEAGKKKVVDKEVVSFDLFDTLFVRRIHDPDLVKLPVARYIASLASKKDLNWNWQNIQALRDSIEQRQRAVTGEKFDDHEACYPVFMSDLLREIFQDLYDESILDAVTRYELEMENSMLVPRPLLVDWIAELSRAGKRVLIISDMYLPASALRELGAWLRAERSSVLRGS